MTAPLMQSVGNAIYIADTETDMGNALQGSVAGLAIRGYGSYEKQKYAPPKIEFEKIKIQSTIGVKFVLK
jgi:hypothetical protein